MSSSALKGGAIEELTPLAKNPCSWCPAAWVEGFCSNLHPLSPPAHPMLPTAPAAAAGAGGGASPSWLGSLEYSRGATYQGRFTASRAVLGVLDIYGSGIY